MDTILREVARLAAALDALLHERQQAEPTPPAGPAGHIEIKTIRGRRYRYLRYWEGGHLRSRYLGKASEDEGSTPQPGDEIVES